MNTTEAYFLLFTDSLVSNLVFNFSTEIIWSTMLIFNHYNHHYILISSSMGYSAAIIINYIFGRAMFSILVSSSEQEKLVSNAAKPIINSKILWGVFLILSAVPFFGKFIIVFSGFCQRRFSIVFITAAMAKLIFYSYFII